MNTERTEQRSLGIAQDKLFALVRALTGNARGREDDEKPLPPGPWDPVIRVALERIAVFGPRPEPWQVRGPGVPWLSIDSFRSTSRALEGRFCKPSGTAPRNLGRDWRRSQFW